MAVTAVALTASGAGCSTQAPHGPGVDMTSSPTALPVVAAPDRFRVRAEQTAASLRSGGTLEHLHDAVVLMQPVMVGGGFGDDGVAKETFLAGLVRLSPRVTGAGWPVTLRPPGLAPRDVVTLGPRETLELATHLQPCGGRGQERCGLTVTGAERGSVSVLTQRGAMTAPVWRFTGSGIDDPLVVVALPPGVLTEAHGAGGAPSPQDGDLLGAASATATGPTSLTVRVYSSACEVDLQAHVWEADDVVVVGGTTGGWGGVAACPAMLMATPAEVRLARPLDGRPVVEVVSGRLLGPERY